MRKHEIESRFNPYIKRLVDEGFGVCLTELAGSYSDTEGQVVFARGGERAVLWMTCERGYGDSVGTLTIHVAQWELAKEKGETLDRDYRWSDDWASHEVASKVFYEVGEDWYTEDKAVAEAAMAKRRERIVNSRVSFGWNRVEVTDRLYGFAKGLKGFKTIKRDNLRVLRHADIAAWRFENITTGT